MIDLYTFIYKISMWALYAVGFTVLCCIVGYIGYMAFNWFYKRAMIGWEELMANAVVYLKDLEEFEKQQNASKQKVFNKDAP